MAPFGTERGSQPGVGQWLGEKGFVGGTRDASTGLTHLGAREYYPQTGRFISVDPIIDVGDPQQMHGYAYANNSPVSFTDPDGLKPLATGGGAEEDAYWKSRGEKLVQDPSSGRWSVARRRRARGRAVAADLRRYVGPDHRRPSVDPNPVGPQPQFNKENSARFVVAIQDFVKGPRQSRFVELLGVKRRIIRLTPARVCMLRSP
ncbi:RHS repeat-associated core domain-containing protein [Solwaraspora sp. WMMD406]|uniref:RHS repeat-associated core domain-containing protein n=1 Tax=Solwaraspora sp. WMMD406 TaxID=3016095 RepID=UPI002417B412|nr:RHS repeat-associated core domain-containing protein [Solwaraspora sp. WMMD406]MDG4763444.1 RHS repeat-associated core domain-containing protein [Solwaraspora sp. WMMD406]